MKVIAWLYRGFNKDEFVLEITVGNQKPLCRKFPVKKIINAIFDNELLITEWELEGKKACVGWAGKKDFFKRSE